LDPENDQFLEETNLPTPMTARVYVNLLDGKSDSKNLVGGLEHGFYFSVYWE